MAIAKLRTNFQDDIINTEITDKRRYNMTQNADGTISLEDVTTYEQIGSDYGSNEINLANSTVNQLIDRTSNIDNTKDSEKRVSYAETAGNSGYATKSGSSENDFILCKKQELVFIGNVCTINNEKITENSLADVYFTGDTISVAEEAVISAETQNGKLLLTSIRSVEGEIKATIKIRVVE